MSFPIDVKKPHDPCKKPDPSHLLVEPIIAHKIYDSCRAQDCLTIVAYAAEVVHIDGKHIHVGDVIPVPKGAGSVEMDGLKLKKISIANKVPSPFKRGFWDVDVRFEFEYLLTFYNCNREIILCVHAFSTHKKRYHLLGSVGADMKMTTDFIGFMSSPEGGAPFVMAEGKAIALKSEFRCNHRDRVPVDVVVTIGLFSIMKLFRIVGLDVESRGFCIPKECEPACPIDPCKFFNGLKFPVDDFHPPVK